VRAARAGKGKKNEALKKAEQGGCPPAPLSGNSFSGEQKKIAQRERGGGIMVGKSGQKPIWDERDYRMESEKASGTKERE